MASSLEATTREVFHKIHLEQIQTESARDRLRTLIDPHVMQVPEDYFQGTTCADLGCGSTVSGTFNLLQLGAAKVYAMDVTDSFIEPGTKILAAESAFNGRWELRVGSLENVPFDSEKFDFVLCRGVIHHVDDDRKAIREIHRVLKPGGKAYLMVQGSGGLLNRFVMEILRDEYSKNPQFKAFFDARFDESVVADQIEWLRTRVTDDGSETYRQCMTLLDLIKALCCRREIALTARDLVQAPEYKLYTEQGFAQMLADAGFSSSYRISRKPHYENVRRLLAPLYEEYDSRLARVVYGEGNITLIATK
jgi:ubiquinone/menaquinone biosynthesis C-methylase UbiE